jgi:hypothetical protein
MRAGTLCGGKSGEWHIFEIWKSLWHWIDEGRRAGEGGELGMEF